MQTYSSIKCELYRITVLCRRATILYFKLAILLQTEKYAEMHKNIYAHIDAAAALLTHVSKIICVYGFHNCIHLFLPPQSLYMHTYMYTVFFSSVFHSFMRMDGRFISAEYNDSYNDVATIG